MIEAKVIEDSLSNYGHRLTTMQLRYPRFIHAEFMTHRMFSRNASSSRAIPVKKMLEQVRTNPAMPVHWGKNQAGMQAREELDEAGKTTVRNSWMEAAKEAAYWAELMEARGAHKQIVNRILEPFQFIHVVVTATEWDNFFMLRCHPDAQPEMQALAYAMRDAMGASVPRDVWDDVMYPEMHVRCWHLPYVTEEERLDFRLDAWTLAKLSAARCARVSYLKHDGQNPSEGEDLKLFERLVGSNPKHASPVEHQAYIGFHDRKVNNFIGWVQFRHHIENPTVETVETVEYHPV